MSDNTKLLLGFIVGAAAGAAIGVLLSSEKGKEMLKKFGDSATDLADDVKAALEKVRPVAEDIGENIRHFGKHA
jgi:gas vesicle protein